MSQYLLTPQQAQGLRIDSLIAPPQGLARAVEENSDQVFTWTQRDGVTAYYFRVEDGNSLVNPVKEGWTDTDTVTYSAVEQTLRGGLATNVRFTVAEYNRQQQTIGLGAQSDDAGSFNNGAPYNLLALVGEVGDLVLIWASGGATPLAQSSFKVEILGAEDAVVRTETVMGTTQYVYRSADSQTDNSDTILTAIAFRVTQVDSEGDAVSPVSAVFRSPVTLPVPPTPVVTDPGA